MEKLETDPAPVLAEMIRRYGVLHSARARNVAEYNASVAPASELPYIVLAVAPEDSESWAVRRIAQMGRAVWIRVDATRNAAKE